MVGAPWQRRGGEKVSVLFVSGEQIQKKVFLLFRDFVLGLKHEGGSSVHIYIGRRGG